MDHVAPTITAIELEHLGEQLSSLRLRPPEALREMERSLARHGQLVAVVCHRQTGSVQVVDGFKRLIGARALGWAALRAEIHEVTGPTAKLLLWHSNARQQLSDLEEAWLVPNQALSESPSPAGRSERRPQIPRRRLGGVATQLEPGSSSEAAKC
jgi:hypothetical protein